MTSFHVTLPEGGLGWKWGVDTSSHRKELAFWSQAHLAWWAWGLLCRCTLTMQGLGSVPSLLLLEAHTVLTWEWTQLFSATPSRASLHLMLLILLLPTLLPTLTDRPTVLSS